MLASASAGAAAAPLPLPRRYPPAAEPPLRLASPSYALARRDGVLVDAYAADPDKRYDVLVRGARGYAVAARAARVADVLPKPVLEGGGVRAVPVAPFATMRDALASYARYGASPPARACVLSGGVLWCPRRAAPPHAVLRRDADGWSPLFFVRAGASPAWGVDALGSLGARVVIAR